MAFSTVTQPAALVGFLDQILKAARAGDADTASLYAWRLHEANHAAALAAIAANAEQEQP